jgi:hypothetical protein
MKSKLEPFLNDIRQRYLNGETAKNICLTYKVYPGSVIEFLRKKGIKIRGNHRRPGAIPWNKDKPISLKKKIQTSKNIFKSKKYLKLSEQTLRSHAKRILIYKNGNICSVCSTSTWNNKPVPLVCDHIDGNPNNNKFINFRLVCCNCDAQLPTFKSKNRGKGRKYDRSYYHKSKYKGQMAERFKASALRAEEV